DVLANKAFPGESAVGKRLFIRSRGQEAEWNDVIGVVEHQRHESLAIAGREAVFLPDGYFGNGAVGTWVLRVSCAEGQPCDPTRGSIFGLVIGDGMKLSALGLAIGLVAAFWLTRAMTTMLVGVRPADPPTYVAILVLFVVIAILACLIPARRAASLDPTSA